MSFLDIKDPAERATLVKEYVTAMKTTQQRNMANRELKLAIGDELQTLFHPIVFFLFFFMHYFSGTKHPREDNPNLYYWTEMTGLHTQTFNI